MAGNYERGMYNQLMEVMAHLDRVERESNREISKLNIEISDLKKENQELCKENLPIHLMADRKRNAKPADKKGIKELL